MDKYIKWYIDEYHRISGKNELIKQVNKKWFTDAINKPPYLRGLLRHEVLDTLRNEVIPHKIDYICTVFKIMRNDFQTSYAYLYSTYIKKEIKHRYVCIGPTYQSCDGEYRKGFIKYKQVEWIHQKYKNIFDLVEPHFLNIVKSKEVLIKSFSYFPDSVDNNKKQLFDENLNQHRIPINLYVIAWTIEYHKIETDSPANHLIPGYAKAMFGDDKKLHDKVIKEMGNDAEETFSLMQFLHKTPELSITPAFIGQKLIPLKVGDMDNYGDINYKPWKEVFISSLVSDLVINVISPSFPIMCNYFFIPTSHPDIYDNAANRLKSKHSYIAQAIVKKLENVRMDTYGDRKNMFISVKMEDLSDAIEIPMDFAEKEIILADKTLCTLVENIGHTAGDIPKLMKVNWWKRSTGEMFKDYDIFSKYIFEWIYALYCMNSKIGIIHGDLHLNNFTIFLTMKIRKLGGAFAYAKNNYVVYQIDDDVYMLPHYGRHGGVIDFSRSFVSSDIIRSQYIEPEAEMQIDNMRRNIMKAYAHEMPEFYESFGPEVEIMMLRNFDIGFKIMTALDTHRLGRGIAFMIEKNQDLGADPKCMTLLRNIQDTARYYLRDVVKKVLSGEITKVDYCNHAIIKKYFKHLLIDNFRPPEDMAIMDIYNYNNEMKYSASNYDTFPETAKWDMPLKYKIPLDVARYKRHKVLMKELENEEEDIEKMVEEFRKKKGMRRGNPDGYKNKNPKVPPNKCADDSDINSVIDSSISSI